MESTVEGRGAASPGVPHKRPQTCVVGTLGMGYPSKMGLMWGEGKVGYSHLFYVRHTHSCTPNFATQHRAPPPPPTATPRATYNGVVSSHQATAAAPRRRWQQRRRGVSWPRPRPNPRPRPRAGVHHADGPPPPYQPPRSHDGGYSVPTVQPPCGECGGHATQGSHPQCQPSAPRGRRPRTPGEPHRGRTNLHCDGGAGHAEDTALLPPAGSQRGTEDAAARHRCGRPAEDAERAVAPPNPPGAPHHVLLWWRHTGVHHKGCQCHAHAHRECAWR